MTNVSNTRAEANKLFRSIIDTERKATNTGARIAALMNAAIASGELSAKQIKTFSEGTSRQQANAILHELCETYSDDYRTAYVDFNNKELAKELRSSSDKVCKAIRKTMTRSLYIASWATDRNAPLSVNKQGDIVLNAGTDDAETFSLRAAETNAKRHYGRTGQGVSNAGQGASGEAAIPLSLALKTISNSMAGLDRANTPLSPQVNAIAQDALIALLGYFGAEDAKAIERIYKAAA